LTLHTKGSLSGSDISQMSLRVLEQLDLWKTHGGGSLRLKTLRVGIGTVYNLLSSNFTIPLSLGMGQIMEYLVTFKGVE
jgi:hypothetical protein